MSDLPAIGLFPEITGRTENPDQLVRTYMMVADHLSRLGTEETKKRIIYGNDRLFSPIAWVDFRKAISVVQQNFHRQVLIVSWLNCRTTSKIFGSSEAIDNTGFVYLQVSTNTNNCFDWFEKTTATNSIDAANGPESFEERNKQRQWFSFGFSLPGKLFNAWQ